MGTVKHDFQWRCCPCCRCLQCMRRRMACGKQCNDGVDELGHGTCKRQGFFHASETCTNRCAQRRPAKLSETPVATQHHPTVEPTRNCRAPSLLAVSHAHMTSGSQVSTCIDSLMCEVCAAASSRSACCSRNTDALCSTTRATPGPPLLAIESARAA